MLDRNGLRPARYLITKGGMMVVASEAGVINIEPADIEEKGRLQPGKILLVDTQEGKIYYDGELKRSLPPHAHTDNGCRQTASSCTRYAADAKWTMPSVSSAESCVLSDSHAKTWNAP